MSSLKSIIICGSNSKKSKSLELSKFLSRSLSIGLLDFNQFEKIPLLNNEIISKKEFPKIINFLLEKIKEFQILIFVFPQYNYNLSGFFKNVIDGCSLKTRSLFFGKRVILIGVSNSEIGNREFQQVSLMTFGSLGGEEMIFINTTPKTNIEKLVKEIESYV